jgi:hypothetical protein
MRKQHKPEERMSAGEFKRVPNTHDRRNPQSVRKTLYDITTALYNNNLPEFADSLRLALRTRMGRSLKSSFSSEGIYGLLIDRTHIKYYHLESYARLIGVPVSLILLYSRMTSNQEDEPPHLNRSMIAAFLKILNDASTKLEENPNQGNLYAIDDFFRWVQIYRDEESLRSQQPQLDLFPPSVLMDE